MKGTHGRSHSHSASLRLALLLLGSLGVLTVSGCRQITDFFSEYRGVNLIAGADFSHEEWELVGRQVGADALTNLDSYIAVSEVSGAAASTEDAPAGAEAASIRRIEILNLLPDGDFDSGDTSAWDPVPLGPTPPSTSIESSGSYAINGNSLRYTTGSGESYLRRRIDGTSGLADAVSGVLPGRSYTLRFDLITTVNTVFGHNNGTDTDYKTWVLPTASQEATLYDFGEIASPAPALELLSSGNQYFSINVPNAEDRNFHDGSIDNVRITRDDIAPALRAAIPVADNQYGDLPFVNGEYSFTVYVRTDPTHTNETADASDNVPNRFPARQVTLRMGVIREESARVNSMEVSVHTDPQEAEDNWQSWTAVSVQGFLQVDDADLSGEPLSILLSVSPNDTIGAFSAAPGSLLIAEPTLELVSQ